MEKKDGEGLFAPEEQEKTETPGQPEKRFGFRMRLGPKNLIAAGAASFFFVLFLWVVRALRWEKPETGEPYIAWWFLIAYGVLALCGVLLCLVEVRLPKGLRRGLGWALVLVSAFLTFTAVELINGTYFPLWFRPISLKLLRMLANYLCYLMVFALIYAISRRAWVTVLAGGGAFLFFGVANYFVTQFRGAPILPLDIQSLGTAMKVSHGYQYVLTRPIVLSFLGLFCAVMLAFRLGTTGREETSRRFRLLERLCALGISVILSVLIFPCNILASLDVEVWPWNQAASTRMTGVAAGFVGNMQFLMVDKPADYSPETVAEIGEEISFLEEPELLGDPGKTPTVIVVMNESLADLENVGELSFRPDNMPFLHSLQDSGEVIWGTAYSSVYGGNTCNSEYEFLTGNTTAFFPSGSIPYQQYVTHEQTALPSIMKSYGYECTAIHPGNRSAWQRDTAYPNLGFDRFIAAADFTVKRDILRGLTTDRSNYDQVIDQYEKGKKSGKPQFIFDVTIQNHSGYDHEDYAPTVQVEGFEGKWPQAEEYLSIVRESDQALEELLGYLSRQEDPVVLLLFGDHWPSLENGFVSELLNADAENLSFEDLMRKYQVPFLLWANYPLEAQHIEEVSINYLSGLLLRAAGLSGTEYTKYLEDLRRSVPVITAIGTLGSDGAWYKNGEETPFDSQLNEYAVLQYNNAFGGEEKAEELFIRQEGGT